MKLLEKSLFYPIFNSTIGLKKRIIRGKDNKLNYKLVLFKNSKIKINGNNNEVYIGKGVKLHNVNIIIKGNNHCLFIGDNCIIKNTEFWFEDSDCKIQIGDGTTIEGANIASAETGSVVSIGEDCMFSQGIQISTTDSHSIIDANTNKRLNKAENISIGNHVWIGAFAKIMKGVNIGNNSIIGMGSIVTKAVSDNSIASGTPAKTVKTEVNWLRQRI